LDRGAHEERKQGWELKFSGASAASAAESPRAAPALALIFGPDLGHARELGDALAARRSKDLGRALGRTRLTEDDIKGNPTRLLDELMETSLFGDAQAIRLRLQGESQSGAVIKTLEAVESGLAPEGMLIVEAGELGTKSRLRKAFEEANKAAAYQLFQPSYSELGKLIRETMRKDGISIDDAALDLLVNAIPPERDAARNEAEKIVLFLNGRSLEATVQDIRELGVGGKEGDSDEAAFEALSGRTAATSLSLTRAFAGGAATVQAVRALERQAKALVEFQTGLSTGRSANEVVSRVFRMRQAETLRQIERWNRVDLDRLLASCRVAEIAIKRAGAPDAAIIERLFLETSLKNFTALPS
jgi:DNA polymerase III subunit delta